MQMNAENLRLKRHYSLVAHSADVVELRHGVWNPVSFTLTDDSGSGRLFELLSALDGSRTTAEIAKDIGVPRGDVEGLVDHLMEIGAMESGPASALDHYLDVAAPTLKGFAGGAADASPPPILLLGDPDLTGPMRAQLAASLPGADIQALPDSDPSLALLTKSDASWLDDGLLTISRLASFASWRGKLVVHASKIVNPVRLQILNRVCLEHKIPWLHAAVDGPFLFVGPLFTPPTRACYTCLETRILMNLRGNEGYLRYKEALAKGRVKLGAPPLEPVLASLLASHASLEVLNYALTRNAFTTSKVLAIHLPTMEVSFNDVLRVPGCPACGPLAERDDTELHFDLRAFMRS